MIMTAQEHPQTTRVEVLSRREVFYATGRARPRRKGAMRERHGDHGFTLVELLIAITLVGIMAAVAIVGLSGITKTSNNSSCSTTLSAAKAAATTYYANTGSYPKTVAPAPFGFEALTTATPSSPIVFSMPSNVSVSGNVMSTPGGWSVTMVAGATSSTPNTYIKTGGGTACS